MVGLGKASRGCQPPEFGRRSRLIYPADASPASISPAAGSLSYGFPRSGRLPMTEPLAIGFLGAGQMATALSAGWKRAGLLDAARSLAADPIPAARTKFEEVTGVKTAGTNA